MKNKTKIIFSNIDWDTDGEKVDLPKEVTINLEELDSDINFELEGADVLSDRYNYCVNSFTFKLK